METGNENKAGKTGTKTTPATSEKKTVNAVGSKEGNEKSADQKSTDQNEKGTSSSGEKSTAQKSTDQNERATSFNEKSTTQKSNDQTEKSTSSSNERSTDQKSTDRSDEETSSKSSAVPELSDELRKVAQNYDESDYRHWIPMVIADKLGKLEEILEDIAPDNSILDSIVEFGRNTDWKGDKKTILKSAATTIGTAAFDAVSSAVRKKMTDDNKKQK